MTIKTSNKDHLTSEKHLKEFALEFCRRTKLNVVSEHHHVFSNPRAITYCFVLSQSHIIFHTWPEYDTISVDLFTCNGISNADSYLQELLNLSKGTMLSYQILSV